MVNTALIPPDLGRLEKRLLQHLHGDQIALTPQSVHCRLDGETLLVALYFETPPFLESTAIFASARDCLAQAGLTALYRPQIFLVLDEELALRDGDVSAIQPQIGAAPDFSALSLGVSAAERSESRRESPLVWLRRHRRPLLGGLGVGVALSLGYALSRPCVLGPCAPLTRAETQLQTVGAFNTPETLTPWATELEALQGIPPWSPYFQRSRALLETDQLRRRELDLLVQSSRLAQGAQRQSDSRLSRELWHGSLRLLAQISPQSPFYALAVARTQDYQRQLHRIDQQVLAQQQANLARRQGNRLLTRGKLKAKGAKTLSDLKAALELWRQGLQHLERIPPESDLYALARQQLTLERAEFKELEAKQALENGAQKTLQDARGSAQKAESAANRRQFSEALRHWQDALESLKAIPSQSWLGPQAQTLLTRYQLAQKQSQQNLQRALRAQSLQRNLKTLCEGPTGLCQYQIESKRIKIVFQSAYLQRLQQAAQEGGKDERAQLLRHIQALERSLQQISYQANLPVDLYRSSGEKIARFQPKGAPP
ncbi:MAG: hypothetical protein GC158_01480 [Cyanobacteria bacterium RI_101]|nr:hypothetical protein [Cyanobacteria bacterium RI_101]